MAESKPKTAKYVSKYRNLTISVKSSYYKAAEDGKKELILGNRVTFAGGYFETSDEGLVAILEKRSDFGTAFVRVPENRTVSEMHDKMRSIDEKDRELKQRESDLDAREKRIKAAEEGGSAKDSGPSTANTDDLDAMNRKELVEVAKTLELSPETFKVGVKNDAIKTAIRAKRAEAGSGSF